MKHIPGPWRVEKVPGGNWYIKAEIQHPNGKKVISNIFEIPVTPHVDHAELKNGKIIISLAYSGWYQFEVGPWNEKTWEANAKLMAAAPKLLQAAKCALADLQELRDGDVSFHDESQIKTIKELKEAINEAT